MSDRLLLRLEVFWRFQKFLLLVGICAREILLMFYANFTGEWFFFQILCEFLERVYVYVRRVQTRSGKPVF